MSSLTPPLSRDDFISDAAYRKYLNDLAAVVELQFLHSRHALLALDKKAVSPLNNPRRVQGPEGIATTSEAVKDKGS